MGNHLAPAGWDTSDSRMNSKRGGEDSGRFCARRNGSSMWNRLRTIHRRGLAGGLLGVVIVSGCHARGPFEAQGAPGRTWTLSSGQDLRITVSTVGPGEFVSPPSISGTAVVFVDVSYTGPAVPSGVSQLFRFSAVRNGTSVITFHHSSSPPNTIADVVDTVVVR